MGHRLETVERLPVALKLSWGAGQLGPATIISIVTAQVLVYLTDHVGIAPAIAGAILFTAKAYDGMSDIVIGLLSDRIDTRWGRRRPWLAAGSIILAISLVTLFRVDELPAEWHAAAATAGIMLFYTGYSLFTVPHMAMAAEISSNYHERTSLQIYASGFAVVSVLLGTSLPPLILIRGGATSYHDMALMLAPLPLIGGAICVIGTAGAPRIAPNHPAGMTLRIWLTTLARNQPLAILLLTKTLHMIGTASLVSALLYFYIQVLGVGQKGMVVLGIAGSAGGAVGVLIAIRLHHIASKHRLYGILLVLLALSILTYLLIPRGRLDGIVFPAFVSAAVGTPALMLATSMVADIVEWDTLRHGTHRAGAITSLVSAIHKMAPAIGALLVGSILSAGGYIPSAGAVQPPGAVRAVVISAIIMPAAMLFAAAIPMNLFYHLDIEALKRGRLTGEVQQDLTSVT